MTIYHVEVHSKDGQVEHYICPDCPDEFQAHDRVANFYRSKNLRIGLWGRENDRKDIGIPYLIFAVEELKSDEPVIFIAGEFRSQFPL